MSIRTALPRRGTTLRLAAPIATAVAIGALAAPMAANATVASPAKAQTSTTSATSSTKAPYRLVPAQERLAVSRLNYASIIKSAKELPMPTTVSAKVSVPLKGANGPAGKVLGTTPKASLALGGTTGVPKSSKSASALITGYDGAVWPGGNIYNPNRQVGKLYFWTGTRYSWCTATVVNSENRSMLLTAGHCVWNTSSRQWYSNWFFYPGYQYGASSLGVWTGRLASTTWNYYNYGWSKEDMAIVLVNKDSAGYSIVDRLGAHGISWNQPVGQYRTSFGYPITDSRWPGYTADGEDLRYCYGNDTYYSSGTYAGQMNLWCRMTGGASGGPWLTNVQSNWLGWANSVNSNKGGVGSAWAYYMFGPYFGNEEAQVYNSWRY